jgi:hypothetical protein
MLETPQAVPLGSLFTSAGSSGAQVDQVAADRGVVPHPGLQDVARQSAGDLAPSGAFG